MNAQKDKIVNMQLYNCDEIKDQDLIFIIKSKQTQIIIYI